MSEKIRVTIWNEYRHEKMGGKVGEIYPEGIHKVLAEYFQDDENYEVRTATLDEPEHGLTDEVLESTDVLFWWGHMVHHEVSDEIVEKVQNRVLNGMGLIVLHSGHHSKIFRRLMGTSCNLKWRVADEKERLWVVEPGHPITEGIGEYIELPMEEMYGEQFEIPNPDELVFISWFEGGEVCRSGCVFYRGRGKVFYFRPGHEEYPTFYRDDIKKVLINAANYVAPIKRGDSRPEYAVNVSEPLEKIKAKE
ncbi:ThuA domain-containing protein [Anaerocolumna xylanovorans]|uniref:Trehalose utilization protein n=1 Tax=Anaerocolumna xylanovorans DSM 12503 TaxID=1121345 RepID=A0A1M7YNF7_9FIRM|nr:ThuA domain-containing protein [Anaerocolumna xylanovorans]SHO54078.1 Trehalose utilization protein [Anaerocolumna xylanovorans DSM 12503]